MKILITGIAGFIGFHLAQRLIKEGYEILGYDNINDYYDTRLKYGRLKKLGFEQKDIISKQLIPSKSFPNCKFIQGDLEDLPLLEKLFSEEKFHGVVNLAAQAGVRYSLSHPHSYVNSNIVGFLNVLEMSRHYNIGHLIYASSSSVYGLNQYMPFSEKHLANHPISIYAASKKSNELMAHSYSHLFNIPTTGLRFFTVYGPWGRPDMALFLFTKAILEGRPIDVYNQGNMQRDFTYIDDIVTGIVKVIQSPPKPNQNWNPLAPCPATAPSPFRIFNIGNSAPIKLTDFIEALEKTLNKTAKKNLLPLQDGDVVTTWADVSHLENELNYKPCTSIQTGVNAFVKWYRQFYSV